MALTGCTSFVVMQDRDIDDALTGITTFGVIRHELNRSPFFAPK